MQDVKYGTTATYSGIAAEIGTSPRVIGRAMAYNPTPLVIPCHRIVAVGGIGGFTPSVEIKESLLAMERTGLQKEQRTANETGGSLH